MATLGCRWTEDNGLSFELLVDGLPLGGLIGSRSTAIPCRIVEDDLPYWPPHAGKLNPDIRIVCVCSCGEYGCGHAHCRVVREGQEIVFRDFDCDVDAEGSRKEFRFLSSNYEAVVGEIVARAHLQMNRNYNDHEPSDNA